MRRKMGWMPPGLVPRLYQVPQVGLALYPVVGASSAPRP